MVPGSGELTVRRALPGDQPALQELLALCLGPGSVPRTPAFWNWKHEENPFGPSPMLVAEAGGRIVGLRTFLRWRWRSASGEVSAVRAVDTATHPDWRGRGLFSQLTRRLLDEMAAEGAAFVFNTPNRASGAGYRKLGWRTAGRVPVLVRPLAPARAAVALARPAGPGGRSPDASKLPEVSALLGLPALDEILAALDRERDDPRLRTPVDRRYLTWRYGSAPGLDYRALWSDGPGPPAALILRPRARGRLREVLVTEILALPGRAGQRAAADLLRQIGTRIEADHLTAVASRQTPERKALRRAGFLPVLFGGPRLVVRTLADSGSRFPDPTHQSAWRLSAGALEIF